MNDPWAFDPNENPQIQNQESAPAGLRSWAEAQKKKNDELAAMVAEMRSELQAQRTSSVFTELGVPASAAKLYKGDTDPEAIKSWVNDVKTAFGIGGQTPLEENSEVPGTTVTPAALTPGQENLFAQLSAAGEGGRPSTGIEDLQRGVGQANSIQDLIANMANLR